MHGWGFGGGRGYPQRFEEQYHCYSVAYADKPQLEVSCALDDVLCSFKCILLPHLESHSYFNTSGRCTTTTSQQLEILTLNIIVLLPSHKWND
jgi:hypothetical protein